MLRIVIIEDEPATARLLQSKLKEIEPVEIIAVLNSVQESVDWLINTSQHFDLLMMDIRLADGLSIEIFNQVKIAVPVIFVTAYEEYMLSAFKTTGIDYILKPFDDQELKRAIAKYHLLTTAQKGSQLLQLQESLGLMQHSLKHYKQSFLIHFREKLIPIYVKEIAFIYTENELSYLYTFDKQKHVIENSLEELTNILDPSVFFRANRQFIVNRNAVKDIEFYFNGRLVINTQPNTNTENIIVSKARVPEFKKWMDM